MNPKARLRTRVAPATWVRRRARRPGQRRLSVRGMLHAAAWLVVGVCVAAYSVSLAVPLWYDLQDQKLLVVTSDSMAPRIRTGDAVVIQNVTDPGQLQVGQVASFWPPGGDRLVTHTIVDLRMLVDMQPDPETGRMEPVLDEAGNPVEKPFIITKGDANEENDPNATPLSRVRGIVLDTRPGWGYVLGWAHSPAGRWTMLAPPLVLIAAMETSVALTTRLRRRRRPREEGRLDALLLD